MTSKKIDKIIKEQEHHNHTFANKTRANLSKYYSITLRCFDYYKSEITDNCKGKKILEIGCGPESLALFLASNDAEVTGIDISPVAIQMSIERNIDISDKIRFMQMDVHNTSFDANSFDIVCGSGVLHHLNIETACLEILRILKPGGKAVFLEPLGHNPFINLYRRLTPSMRTVDEHPLKNKDVCKLEEIFYNIKTVNFNMLNLLAIPFRHMPIFIKVTRFLSAIDSYLFKSFPVLKSWAWMIVITVRK